MIQLHKMQTLIELGSDANLKEMAIKPELT